MTDEKSPAEVSAKAAAGKKWFRSGGMRISFKMILGHLPLALFMVLVSIFALAYLERLNRVNVSIIKTDVPLIEASKSLMDRALAQELYRRRYSILQGPDVLRLFWKNGTEFDQILEQVRSLSDKGELSVEKLAELHEEYNQLFIKSLSAAPEGRNSDASASTRELNAVHEKITLLIKEISLAVHARQGEKLRLVTNIGSEAVRVIAFLCLAGMLFGLGASVLITGRVSRAIKKLKVATLKISEGSFDHAPSVSSGDELEDLSNAFGEMSQKLKRLEKRYLDASPLTRLPGNVVIETILQKRIINNLPLAFCLVDLDDFKAFNDRYGYARGSEVIKMMAAILDTVLQEHGSEDDFIGHIGGDDFVIITEPERFQHLCEAVINEFERGIVMHYDEEDRRNGFIEGKTRQGDLMKFPVMSLSIAVVTSGSRKLSSHVETGEIAAELKAYAKSLPGSNYVVDYPRSEQRLAGGGKVVPFSGKESRNREKNG